MSRRRHRPYRMRCASAFRATTAAAEAALVVKQAAAPSAVRILAVAEQYWTVVAERYWTMCR
eukprot:3015305-Pleurochrysis_carterae.AAC.2